MVNEEYEQFHHCSTDNEIVFNMTVPLSHLCCLVVTEEELALALDEGEEGITPPGPATASSTNGLTEADSEYDPLNCSMEETK